MIIFWRLLLSHLLADFTLQLNIVNTLKRKNVWGMIIHCMTHFVTAVILVRQYLSDVWGNVFGVSITGWRAMFLLLIFHFIVDEARVWAMKKKIFHDNTLSFMFDQIIHVYVLFMLSPITISDNFMVHEKWVLIVSMLVLVTHASTVLIYFIEKDLKGLSFPNFDEKYFLIFERLVIWAFFFVQGNWWIFFLVAWIFQIFYIRKRRIIDLSIINIVVSIFIACGLGLITRLIYYGRI